MHQIFTLLLLCFTFYIICHTTNYVSLLCSGMKPLNFSVEACRWKGIGRTSATMIGALRDLRLLTICMSFWGATTTLGRRWPAIRHYSYLGSSSRLMSSKISKDVMGQKTLKTMAISTGTTFVVMYCWLKHHRSEAEHTQETFSSASVSNNCNHAKWSCDSHLSLFFVSL